MAGEVEQTSATREVEGKQGRAGRGQGDAVRKTSIAVRVGERRYKPVIDNAEVVIFVEKRLLVITAYLQIVDPLHIRQRRAYTGIQELAILRHRLLLDGEREIVEGVTARIIV